MKNKKFVMVMMMTAVMAAGNAGCGNRTEAQMQEQEVHQDVSTEEKDEKPDAIKPEIRHEDTEEKEEPQVEEPEEETEKPEEEETAGFDGELSDDWTDLQFIFDGKAYELPAAYSELEENGWSFDLADYGYTDGYIMNPGDKTYGTIELSNPDYDEDLTVWVGFINTDDKAQDILDCDIWSFQLDTCHGFEQVGKYPDMELAKGIGIGSSREEVEAAFGVCDDIYESDPEYGYVTYNYSVDYTYYLKLTIYEDKGVTAIEISSYE